MKILFLCTGNSCRSQMAEGWARHLLGDSVEAYSAGIEKRGLNPLAVQVMQEAGVDIREQHSKTVDELGKAQFDVVVTVCDHADRHCPTFPGASRTVHVGFEDPPKLARSAATQQEALEHYRRVRDQIRDFVGAWPNSLPDTDR
jgi:arsenate reductase